MKPDGTSPQHYSLDGENLVGFNRQTAYFISKSQQRRASILHSF